jgi:hypothetical protein
MGQRTIPPGEAEGFSGHFDIERFWTRIGDDRSHRATTPVMAGNEMQQQVVLGMFAASGRECDNEGGEQLVPEVFWQLGLVAEELLEGECPWTTLGESDLRRQGMQPATVEHRLEARVEFAEVVPGPCIAHSSSQRFWQTPRV